MNGDLNILYKNDNHVFGFSSIQENFVLGISTPTDPCNFFWLKHNGEVTRLTTANEKLLNEVDFIKPEEIKFTSQDGWEIQGWIMRPYQFEKGKKYPFVLEIHGGPHAMYGQTFFMKCNCLRRKDMLYSIQTRAVAMGMDRNLSMLAGMTMVEKILVMS